MDIKKRIESHLETIEKIKNEETENKLRLITDRIVESFNKGGKLLIFGNGGSASDAQHIAGEMINRFLIERKALPAIALNVDTSVLTAISNDYSFDEIFEKQIEALAKDVDIAIGISTSGNSENVNRGIEKAKEIGAFTIGFTAKNGNKLESIADIVLAVPSKSTPRIQEAHILLAHIICEMVEDKMFGASEPEKSEE